MDANVREGRFHKRIDSSIEGYSSTQFQISVLFAITLLSLESKNVARFFSIRVACLCYPFFTGKLLRSFSALLHLQVTLIHDSLTLF